MEWTVSIWTIDPVPNSTDLYRIQWATIISELWPIICNYFRNEELSCHRVQNQPKYSNSAKFWILYLLHEGIARCRGQQYRLHEYGMFYTPTILIWYPNRGHSRILSTRSRVTVHFWCTPTLLSPWVKQQHAWVLWKLEVLWVFGNQELTWRKLHASYVFLQSVTLKTRTRRQL